MMRGDPVIRMNNTSITRSPPINRSPYVVVG